MTYLCEDILLLSLKIFQTDAILICQLWPMPRLDAHRALVYYDFWPKKTGQNPYHTIVLAKIR